MAIVLLWSIQSARLRVVRYGNKRARRGPYVNLEIPSVAAKGALQFPGQHGDFSVVDNTARGRARARARARARVCALYAAAVNGYVEAPC